MDIINAWFAPWYNINPNLQKATEMNLFKKLGLSLVLFAPIHFRKAARIISSQTQLKSNCSAIAEIRFINSPIRMRDDCISVALRCVDVRRGSRLRPLTTRRRRCPYASGGTSSAPGVCRRPSTGRRCSTSWRR